MTYENTGRLFKNDRKQSDKAPDYTGDFTDENGKKWRLAAWLKDGQRGKWMSLKVSEFEQQQTQQRQPRTQSQSYNQGEQYSGESYASEPPQDEVPF